MISPYSVNAYQLKYAQTIKPRVYLAPSFSEGGSLFINNQKDEWLQIDMKLLKKVDNWVRVNPLKQDHLKMLKDFEGPKNGQYKK